MSQASDQHSAPALVALRSVVDELERNGLLSHTADTLGQIADDLEEQYQALREAVAVAIEDVLLMDSPEGDSPRNIASNLRDALGSNPAKRPDVE